MRIRVLYNIIYRYFCYGILSRAEATRGEHTGGMQTERCKGTGQNPFALREAKFRAISSLFRRLQCHRIEPSSRLEFASDNSLKNNGKLCYRALGIDYGSRRIGLALSDPTRSIASSHSVINRISLKKDIKIIVEVIREHQVKDIVIGMPVSLNGTEGPKAKEVLGFIEEIKKRINIPIIQWDERFTTTLSERMLIGADVSRKKRRKVIDKVAASVMLQGFLDAKRNE